MMKFTCLSQDSHYLDLFLLIYWSRKWQTTPVFLSGEFHSHQRLVGYSPWGHKESDRTGQLKTAQHITICTYNSIYLVSSFLFFFFHCIPWKENVLSSTIFIFILNITATYMSLFYTQFTYISDLKITGIQLFSHDEVYMSQSGQSLFRLISTDLLE